MYLIVGLGGVLIVVNFLCAIVYYCLTPRGTKINAWFGKKLGEFKFNAYIRYYMLSYYDLTFFSIMKLTQGDPEPITNSRKMANIASYVILVGSVVIPFLLSVLICNRFPYFKVKESKASFNTLIVKLDKGRRLRIISPIFFFIRRFATAVMLTVPLDSKLIFL